MRARIVQVSVKRSRTRHEAPGGRVVKCDKQLPPGVVEAHGEPLPARMEKTIAPARVAMSVLAAWLCSLVLSGCPGKREDTVVDEGQDLPCEDGDLACPDGVLVDAARVRQLGAAVDVPEEVSAIAVGDLAGTGVPQVYVGTRNTITRLDGDAWDNTTELWSTHSGPVRPLIAELTGDDLPDLAFGLPRSDEGAGQVVVYEGPVTEPVDWGDPHVELKGDVDSETGWVVSSADLNADGSPDLLVDRFVRFGPITDDGNLGGDDDASFVDGSDASMQGAPRIGDVDGDGMSDLVFAVSLPSTDDYCRSWPGELRVFLGPIGAGEHSMDEAHLSVPMPEDSAFLGFGIWLDGGTIQVQDIDGDTHPDVLVTTFDMSSAAMTLPEILVWSGPLSAGDEPTGRFGFLGLLGALGDLDGDGWLDLIQADCAASALLGPVAEADCQATVLAGPLTELVPFDPTACSFSVEERWTEGDLVAVWSGDLDGSGSDDAVVATEDGAWVVLESAEP